MYLCEITNKLAVEDSYTEGWIGKATDIALDITLKSDTQEGLLEEMANFFGLDVKDLRPKDGSPDMFEVSVLENREGFPASRVEIERWKRGEVRLWDAIFTMHCYATRPLYFHYLLEAENA